LGKSEEGEEDGEAPADGAGVAEIALLEADLKEVEDDGEALIVGAGTVEEDEGEFEELEAAEDGEEDDEGGDGADGGERDVEEAMEGVGAIHGGGFEELGVNVLQGGEEVDHVETDVDPEGGEDHGEHDVFLEPGEVEIEVEEVVEGDVEETGALFKDDGEKNGDEDEADEGGREEDEAEEGAAFDIGAVEEEGEGEGDGELDEDGGGGEERGVGEGFPEEMIVEDE